MLFDWNQKRVLHAIGVRIYWKNPVHKWQRITFAELDGSIPFLSTKRLQRHIAVLDSFGFIGVEYFAEKIGSSENKSICISETGRSYYLELKRALTQRMIEFFVALIGIILSFLLGKFWP